MKTIICIMLLGYWMFGAAPENTGQTAKLKRDKEQMFAQNQNSLPDTKATGHVIYLDAKGSIVKAESKIK